MAAIGLGSVALPDKHDVALAGSLHGGRHGLPSFDEKYKFKITSFI